MSGPYRPDKHHHRDDSPAELKASRVESRVNRSQRSCANVKRVDCPPGNEHRNRGPCTSAATVKSLLSSNYTYVEKAKPLVLAKVSPPESQMTGSRAKRAAVASLWLIT